MVDGADPTGILERLALRIRDRDDGHIGELSIEWDELWQIQPAVQRRDMRNRQSAHNGEVNVRDVEVHEVEVGSLLRHLLDHQDMFGNRIESTAVEPLRSAANRNERRLCDRVTAGKQGHIVALTHEFIGQKSDDTFGAAVQLRRYPFTKWSNLGNSHRFICTHRVDRSDARATTLA